MKVMQEDIIRDSKAFKQSKLNNVKKATDHLAIIQKDLQTCVAEYQKVKNSYIQEGEDKSNNKILKKNKKRIKPSANTTNALLLSMITANTHQVTIQSGRTSSIRWPIIF